MKAEIEKVTVDTMPEVYARMRKHGWAILRDCTDIFHPKARFTREQMTFIDKCKFTHLLQFVAKATLLYLTFIVQSRLAININSILCSKELFSTPK
jgi:hypothetical protein